MFKQLSWSRDTLRPDLSSGLTVALVSIPEGMAYALVAGVDPVYGLYTGMVTTIVAALTGSTSLMIVTLTNALALVTADAIAGLGSDADITAVFTLTFLVGAIMFLLGVLKLGSIIRFVSREVMSGFVFATALLVALGQYDELVGYASELDANKFIKAIDITLNISEWDVQTAIVGFASIIVLLLLKRIVAVEKYADVLIIMLAGMFVYIVSWASVELVADIADVPVGLDALPKPTLPDFSLLVLLIPSAIAAAVVGLAESSGAGTAYPNPDGSRSNMSQDFTAQGLGNLIGSFFQALPAGGSLSRTGVNAGGGAKTRWSGAYAGIALAVVLFFFGNLTEYIPMTALAAMLIVIGFEVMIKEGKELAESWRVNRLATGVAGLVIVIAVFDDLTVAIFAGVILSLMLFTFTAVSETKVVQVLLRDDGRLETVELPEKLPSNQATVVQALGTVYFASTYSFDDLLPDFTETHNAVLILRMRGRAALDATSVGWLENHVPKTKAAGNLMMLCDVQESVLERLKLTEAYELIGEENIFPAEPVHEASVEKALAAAEKWMAEHQQAEESD